jgi:hypothetical protein
LLCVTYSLNLPTTAVSVDNTTVVKQIITWETGDCTGGLASKCGKVVRN